MARKDNIMLQLLDRAYVVTQMLELVDEIGSTDIQLDTKLPDTLFSDYPEIQAAYNTLFQQAFDFYQLVGRISKEPPYGRP